MEEGPGFTFDDFSVEMEDMEVRQVRKYDRIWHIGPGGSISSGAVVKDGIVYFGSRDQVFYAVDAGTGKLVWKYETRGMICGGIPVVEDGVVYFGSRDRFFYALDARTGELIWKYQTNGGIACCGCCVDVEKVYFGSSDRFVYALRRESGKLAWKHEAMDAVVSMPVLSEGRLFIGSFDQNLYCLDPGSGTEIWRFPTHAEIFNYTPFLVHEGRVFFTSFDNHLRSVDIRTGKLAWKFRTGYYGISSGTSIHRGVIYQGCRDGTLYAINPADGSMRWKYATNKLINPVAFHGDSIFFGCEDHNLYCLDLEGRLRWKFAAQDGILGGIFVWDGRIFFGSYDCNMYSVDLRTHEQAWKFRARGAPCFFPPPYESFEVVVKTPSLHKEELPAKEYELEVAEDGEEGSGVYKSGETYQVKMHYREKGKYQVDSDEATFRMAKRRQRSRSHAVPSFRAGRSRAPQGHGDGLRNAGAGLLGPHDS